MSASQFVEEAVPAGEIPPVITLSACNTNVPSNSSRSSFASQLCQLGAAAVIATEASISDNYATRLLSEVYGRLAQASQPDVIAALSEARRNLQDQLINSRDKRDRHLAIRGDWAAVTILTSSGRLALLDQESSKTRVGTSATTARPAGPDGRSLVGRRTEQRHWPKDLTAPDLAGIAICGAGGTGKTTLAAAIVARVQDHDASHIPVVFRGPVTAETFLGYFISALRRELNMRGNDDAAALRALEIASRLNVPWNERFTALRHNLLDHVPVILMLDNFEDNLAYVAEADGKHVFRDTILAELVAVWLSDPGVSRFLFTSRYQFKVPGSAENLLSFRHLGPLSRAETMKFVWSLPALDSLSGTEIDRIWQLVGGHPRSLEYLNALLSTHSSRYAEVATRLDRAINARLSGEDQKRWTAPGANLDAALAETVSRAADDVLLDSLLERLSITPGAATLLLGASVYREPVEREALLYHVASREQTDAEKCIEEILNSANVTIKEGTLDLSSLPADVQALVEPHLARIAERHNSLPPEPPGLFEQITACQATGLLMVDSAHGDPRFFVHRWTATELAERAGLDQSKGLKFAHMQAAHYWEWHCNTRRRGPYDQLHGLLEARYHLLAAGLAEPASAATNRVCTWLFTHGAWEQAASLIRDTLRYFPATSHEHAAFTHELGMLADRQGDYEEAERLFTRALEIEERLGNRNSMASTHHMLGILFQHRGDYDRAASHFDRSLAIKKELHEPNDTDIAAYSGELGNLAYLRGEYEKAGKLFVESLRASQRARNPGYTATSYYLLGQVAARRGTYDGAVQLYNYALDINKGLGNRREIAACYHQLGNVAFVQGDYSKAFKNYQLSISITEHVGDRIGAAATYSQLGLIAQHYRDNDEFARQIHRSREISEKSGDLLGVAQSILHLGGLSFQSRDYPKASEHYRQALSVSERLGNEALTAFSWQQLGATAKRMNDFSDAENCYQRALEIAERINVVSLCAESLYQIADLSACRHDDHQSAAHYLRALKFLEQDGDKRRLGVACAMLGIYERINRNYESSSEYYKRAIGLFRELGHEERVADMCTELGKLEIECGTSAQKTVSYHLTAFVIRRRLGSPDVHDSLNSLSDCRRRFGSESFCDLVIHATHNSEKAEKVIALLDRHDQAGSPSSGS